MEAHDSAQAAHAYAYGSPTPPPQKQTPAPHTPPPTGARHGNDGGAARAASGPSTPREGPSGAALFERVLEARLAAVEAAGVVQKRLEDAVDGWSRRCASLTTTSADLLSRLHALETMQHQGGFYSSRLQDELVRYDTLRLQCEQMAQLACAPLPTSGESPRLHPPGFHRRRLESSFDSDMACFRDRTTGPWRLLSRAQQSALATQDLLLAAILEDIDCLERQQLADAQLSQEQARLRAATHATPITLASVAALEASMAAQRDRLLLLEAQFRARLVDLRVLPQPDLSAILATTDARTSRSPASRPPALHPLHASPPPPASPAAAAVPLASTPVPDTALPRLISPLRYRTQSPAPAPAPAPAPGGSPASASPSAGSQGSTLRAHGHDRHRSRRELARLRGVRLEGVDSDGATGSDDDAGVDSDSTSTADRAPFAGHVYADYKAYLEWKRQGGKLAGDDDDSSYYSYMCYSYSYEEMAPEGEALASADADDADSSAADAHDTSLPFAAQTPAAWAAPTSPASDDTSDRQPLRVYSPGPDDRWLSPEARREHWAQDGGGGGGGDGGDGRDTDTEPDAAIERDCVGGTLFVPPKHRLSRKELKKERRRRRKHRAAATDAPASPASPTPAAAATAVPSSRKDKGTRKSKKKKSKKEVRPYERPTGVQPSLLRIISLVAMAPVMPEVAEFIFLPDERDIHNIVNGVAPDELRDPPKMRYFGAASPPAPAQRDPTGGAGVAGAQPTRTAQ